VDTIGTIGGHTIVLDVAGLVPLAGHSSAREEEAYTRAADQKRLAREAIGKIT